MKASLLMLTIDRFETTKKVFEANLASARVNLRLGVSIEVLVCDNGSQDQRVIDYFKSKKIHYHRVNARNEGCARSFNQLFLRSTGELIVLLGNDILLPDGWLEEGIRYAYGVPNSGIIGIDWGHGGVPAMGTKFGVHAHYLDERLDKVFGVWMLKRRVIEEIGFFAEEFEEYGLEDSDFNNRVNLAGFNSYYLPNMRSQHLENDVGTSTAYRQMKDRSMQRNLAILSRRIGLYDTVGIREPLPEARDAVR